MFSCGTLALGLPTTYVPGSCEDLRPIRGVCRAAGRADRGLLACPPAVPFSVSLAQPYGNVGRGGLSPLFLLKGRLRRKSLLCCLAQSLCFIRSTAGGAVGLLSQAATPRLNHTTCPRLWKEKVKLGLTRNESQAPFLPPSFV